MVELEMDGFILQVPLKPKMTIHEFVDAVNKVEVIAHANDRGMHAREQAIAAQPAFAQPLPSTPQITVPVFAPSAQPLPENFHLPNEDAARVLHISNQVRSHVDHLKRHEDVLSRHEKHLAEILQYLQSLDRYIRK